MTLTNIEYGSLASSEVMNNNFSFLENKISTSVSELSTNLSSILSNIATINTRLTDLSDALTDSVTEINSKINELKSKVSLALNKVSLVPDWSNIYTLESLSNYTATANGYVLIISGELSQFDFTVNNVAIDGADKNGVLILPVKKGDIIACSVDFEKMYFIPVSTVSLDS